jgi:hypothetical protein
VAQTLLLIADIGGYTRFMNQNRMTLSHAQQLVADLLGALLDEAEGVLEVSKLEGDAVLFYSEPSRAGPSAGELEQALVRMRATFAARRDQFVADNDCGCEACQQASRLTLKFVAHHGEVALQKVRGFRELAGVDVILIHRMLKNDVPVAEYLLTTDPAQPYVPPTLLPRQQGLTHDFEGLGPTQTWYAELGHLPSVPSARPRRRGWAVRMWAHGLFMLRAMGRRGTRD